MRERVVITGLGAVSPVGLDVPSTWESLLAGRSGAGYITRFDASEYETKVACEVKGFDPSQYIDRKELRRMDRYTHFAIAAAKQAVEDSGLKLGSGDNDDVGVVVGTGIGGIETITAQYKILAERGPNRLSPFACTMFIANIAAGQIAILLRLRGPNFATVSACASGAHAIGEAYETIRRGDVPVMLAGGAEAPVVGLAVGAFNCMHALSTRNDPPEAASRPFDAKRDGFVVGEGSGILVLESAEHALARGARIYGEIVGYAATADASHVTAPAAGGAGALLAMRRALSRSGLRPEDVDYINAHGTSTVLNDKTETAAIKSLFGEQAYQIPINSTKSMTGHMMGGGGALEAIVCVLSIRDGILHPTINQEYPDPECDLDYVPNVARRHQVRVAMSNSLGFGGHNAALVIRDYRP